MDVFFQSYTCLIYSKCSEQLSDFVLYCKLLHTREPWYQVSVRQARSLPKTSFRLHLAMNTLVVGWTLPAVRARWGLTPVRIRSCWANNQKEGKPFNGFPSFPFHSKSYLLNFAFKTRSMSCVIISRSYVGAQSHSLRAQVSSNEFGHDSAML